MHDGACWPVRSTQRTIIVLTLQASLENQSFTGLHCLLSQTAHPGLRPLCPFRADECNVSFYAYSSTKNSAEYFIDFEHPTCKGRRVQHHNELCAPCRGKLVKTTNAGASPCAIICRLYGTCQARFFIVHQYIFHAV